MIKNNHFYHMNCFEGLAQMEDESVDFILTDIPYLISRKTNFKEMKRYLRKNKEERGYEGMEFGEWDKEFDVARYIQECCRVLKKGRSLIVFCSWQQLKEVDDYVKQYLGKETGSSRIGVWEKTNPAVFNMDKMPLNTFEFFVWNRKGKNWVFHNQRGKRMNKGKEVQIPERFIFHYPVVVGGHQTAKPIGLFEELIRTFTDEGQVVLDGCAGGGTTAISALKNNRQFICFESDSDNYEIARQNFVKHSFEPKLYFEDSH